MDNRTVKPSRWWFAVAGLAALVGVGGAGWFVWTGIVGIEKTLLAQFIVPGKQKLELKEAGEYLVFYESQAVVGDRVFAGGRGLPGMTCTMEAAEDGERVALRKPNANTTYTLGGRSGESVLAFTIEKPGGYEISCSYGSGGEGPEGVLAIGKGTMALIFSTVIYGLALAFGGVALAVGISVVIALKRSKNVRRAAGIER